MSEGSDSGFLGRWARRKAQVSAQISAQVSAQEKKREQEREQAQELEPQAAAHGADSAAPEAEPFDLASLPSLDEINAATDMKAFLRREVPDWLRNAALKKAWAADPAIRDYVNPAMEYAFDWNAPGGVPGGGPLEAGYDAAREALDMLSQPAGGASRPGHLFVDRSSAEGAQEETQEGAQKASQEVEIAASQQEAPPANAVRLSAAADRASEGEGLAKTSASGSAAAAPAPAAARKPADPPSTPPANPPADPPAPRRRHGGAAPA